MNSSNVSCAHVENTLIGTELGNLSDIKRNGTNRASHSDHPSEELVSVTSKMKKIEFTIFMEYFVINQCHRPDLDKLYPTSAVSMATLKRLVEDLEWEEWHDNINNILEWHGEPVDVDWLRINVLII